MEKLSNKFLIYKDSNYRHSANYSYKYNYPITLNFGEKHNRTKYIISAGTSDNITLLKDGIFIYVIAENNGLNYIGMQCINTELKCIESEVFLHDSDLNDNDSFSHDILEMNAEDQCKILSEYL